MSETTRQPISATATLHLRFGWCTYVSWQGFVCTLVESERVVQKEFRDAARGKPREAAVISQAPEGEAPITIESVPPEKCRLRHGTSHRLDGIPHEFAYMPDFIHHTVTIRPSHRDKPSNGYAVLLRDLPAHRTRSVRLRR